MLNLNTLFFRVNRSKWVGSKHYAGVLDDAYASLEEATADLPDDFVVVTWDEITQRLYGDIYHAAQNRTPRVNGPPEKLSSDLEGFMQLRQVTRPA